MDAWHKQRGFTRNRALFPQHRPDLKYIGYHLVNRVNGAAECGRHELETGAHCIDYNTNGIGICMVGTDRFSLAQWATLKPQVYIVGR
ncbi:MAG: N-acetylmuramoyl-L-alanine amidase [Methylovulum sp.]|nr:N-acetylmuramoyl-L-alanine amidase [Methylovulum sp.]